MQPLPITLTACARIRGSYSRAIISGRNHRACQAVTQLQVRVLSVTQTPGNSAKTSATFAGERLLSRALEFVCILLARTAQAWCVCVRTASKHIRQVHMKRCLVRERRPVFAHRRHATRGAPRASGAKLACKVAMICGPNPKGLPSRECYVAASARGLGAPISMTRCR